MKRSFLREAPNSLETANIVLSSQMILSSSCVAPKNSGKANNGYSLYRLLHLQPSFHLVPNRWKMANIGYSSSQMMPSSSRVEQNYSQNELSDYASVGSPSSTTILWTSNLVNCLIDIRLETILNLILRKKSNDKFGRTLLVVPIKSIIVR